jgi:hypothetical protein
MRATLPAKPLMVSTLDQGAFVVVSKEKETTNASKRFGKHTYALSDDEREKAPFSPTSGTHRVQRYMVKLLSVSYD